MYRMDVLRSFVNLSRLQNIHSSSTLSLSLSLSPSTLHWHYVLPSSPREVFLLRDKSKRSFHICWTCPLTTDLLAATLDHFRADVVQLAMRFSSTATSSASGYSRFPVKFTKSYCFWVITKTLASLENWVLVLLISIEIRHDRFFFSSSKNLSLIQNPPKHSSEEFSVFVVQNHV